MVRGLQMMLSTVLSISLKRLIWALLENLSCKGWSKTFWKNWGLETIRKWNKDVEKWQIYSAQIFFASYSLQPVCTGIEDFYINHVYIWFVFIDEIRRLEKTGSKFFINNFGRIIIENPRTDNFRESIFFRY